MREPRASHNLRVGRSEEQAARNESIFREANERLAERRAELSAVEGRTPYLCECEDESCTEIVRLTAEDYEAVRADPTHFVIVPDHPTHGAEIVRSGAGWICVAKAGASGAIVREADPRSA